MNCFARSTGGAWAREGTAAMLNEAMYPFVLLVGFGEGKRKGVTCQEGGGGDAY